MQKINVTATSEMHGLRLDKALALIEEIGTRSRASHLIDSSAILLNGKTAKASATVKENDQIEITLPEAVPSELQPYDFKLDILFEDEDLIVINKPAGLVVHPAAGHAHDTLVNALIAHTEDLSMKFGEERPGIVHRLDKETSGIIVTAKNDKAHESLTAQFKERSTHRIYYAVCVGTAKALSSGTIKSFLARHPTDRKRYASVLDEDKRPYADKENPPEIGKWAVTHYEVLNRKSGLSYLKLKLETGRTHQIRVHLSETGLPIAGDVLYGADKKTKNIEARETQESIRGLNRFLLHAAELGFTHPRTQERMFFQKDWPEDILQLLKKWGLR
ncbi:MAG: pseudouridylate synthase [Bdellovibrio sp. ArHS]|uniref:RluA family pseudouridine synthase n=1 Tax=Bdellovibrio sp. ArHS TaxID=1569284 RepID=UPI0005838288|nr:RluA family pseudouridine synthase [Bdellovibrio sp. ArHS]KHD88032.1 MAG: pseudouridylate synthase [Bdellovibrio sp. ArHS]